MTEGKLDMDAEFDFSYEAPEEEFTPGLLEDDVHEPSSAEAHDFVAGLASPEYADEVYPAYSTERRDSEWPEFVFQGPKEKKLRVSHDKMGTFWSVEWIGGGELPANLKGSFTNEAKAIEAVKLYLAANAE